MADNPQCLYAGGQTGCRYCKIEEGTDDVPIFFFMLTFYGRANSIVNISIEIMPDKMI